MSSLITVSTIFFTILWDCAVFWELCDIVRSRTRTPGQMPCLLLNMLIVVFICRCLLDHGADVAAVNNEGELPLDLAEEEDMEDLLTDEIERLGKLRSFSGTAPNCTNV